ncbi:MAG: hypothetical protein JO328_19920 [Hyphomicrobiales bacterium]|nr:hypothetical protein [Hyphomicrobiales bacterium]MBV9428791.1 hypothetical protein [Bradyrhizobiaceae bacterium]
MRFTTRGSDTGTGPDFGITPACFFLISSTSAVSAVDERARIEIGRLAVQNVLGELEHVGREFAVRDVLEILRGVADLIGVAQRRAEQAFVLRLEGDDVLALRRRTLSHIAVNSCCDSVFRVGTIS